MSHDVSSFEFKFTWRRSFIVADQKKVGAFQANVVFVSVLLRSLASSSRPRWFIENGTLLTSEDFLKFMASAFYWGAEYDADELFVIAGLVANDDTVASPKLVLISGLFVATPILPLICAKGKWERLRKS